MSLCHFPKLHIPGESALHSAGLCAVNDSYKLHMLWIIAVTQRFSNFFQVGTTFISKNVLRTTLLLSPLKANCLRFSTVVCDTQSR
jgi:hypothetical protein